MRYLKAYLISLIACCFTASLLPLAVWAQIPHPNTYIPSFADFEKHKTFYDDPKPILKDWGPKQVLPKQLYDKLCYDEEKMKSLWAEIVGFRAPDVVGKIAPEINPGKYTYKDLEKYPGFKELMMPYLYSRIKPGGSPFIGNIPEFEVIPTRQYYWGLPIAEATKRNEGKTKLDKDGYIVTETWEAGYPFPKPSGPFKAQQIMFNVEKRALSWEGSFIVLNRLRGWTKNLKEDFVGALEVRHMKLGGRTLMEPFGWFDKRAKDRGEFRTFVMNFTSPRDIAGMAQSALYYLDPNKADNLMIYIPSLRRIRKLSATDSQDPVSGQDLIYDDNEGFLQKLSPTRYPYKYEIVEEREFLMIANSLDGSEYLSSKGMEFRNIKLERRPIYVVKLTQLDPNYVYSKRIFYIDKETFNYHHIANYDQKGRLYRTFDANWGWHPEMGTFSLTNSMNVLADHVDLHSSMVSGCQFPTFWNRDDVSIEGFIKQK